MLEVNGKQYPLWSQFVEKKEQWIGGKLRDSGDSMDRAVGLGTLETEIIDVTLKPNGDDSAFFSVHGKDFTCGFDVQYGGISGSQRKGWLEFHGYGGHTWWIQEKN